MNDKLDDARLTKDLLGLDEDADWFGKNHARKVDRMLKKALDKARERGLKASKGGNAGARMFKDTLAATRASYLRTLKQAIVRQAGKTQKSVRPTTI